MNTSIFSNIWQSLVKRHLESRKQKRTIEQWLQFWPQFPKEQIIHPKTLIIVRLDDIGDYILFRPALSSIRQSKRFSDWKITLLGNMVWQDLFDSLDKNEIDDFIPFNKKKWFADSNYRKQLLTRLNELGPELVWLPSRSRHFLLDDLVASSFVCSKIYSSGNFFSDYKSNFEKQFVSNLKYEALVPDSTIIHEWTYNEALTKLFCNHSNFKNLSQQEEKILNPYSPYIVFFPGASAGSKRWPPSHFVKIGKWILEESELRIIIAGSNSDATYATEILKALPLNNRCFSFCGETTLFQLLNLLQQAECVLSNDTSAAHMAALSNVHTIAICNGNKFGRFFPYPSSFTKVESLFPDKNIPILYSGKKNIKKITTIKVLQLLKKIYKNV